MTTHIGNKLNQLGRDLPEGLLVDAPWLERQGYYSSLRSQYVSAGWLEQPARGVFRRLRGSVSWEQVVISLQTLLGYPVSVGGRTALELQGYAHYLPQSQSAIHLYSDRKIPSWLFKLSVEQTFVVHNRSRFLPGVELLPSALSLTQPVFEDETILNGGLRIIPWGQWRWPLVISTPERAYLELLDELPQHETFHMADVIMEGLVNVSPRRIQSLLEHTQSVKVKRLFFFFADRHNHSWLSRIEREKIDLGQGKRMLVKGGKLNAKYQITVPEEFAKESGNGF
jgi:Transcriptional regulator, AbiEi antitoxin, Type IV TA system/Transcriptional regulator, AbiEi antitoxin N-terminal domain